MPRDGTKNLKPQNMRTKEEQRELARKAGIASGEARRKIAKEKDKLKALMKCLPELTPERIRQLEKMGIDAEGLDNESLMMVALLGKALTGNVLAVEYIDKRLGNHPDTKIKARETKVREREIDLKEKLAEDVTRIDYEDMKDRLDRNYNMFQNVAADRDIKDFEDSEDEYT